MISFSSVFSSVNLFYRQFRICITKASGKVHTPALRYNPIITNIGRENKFAAVFLCLSILC